METYTVAFQSIGFAANLILNRLRNERHVADDRRKDDEARRKQDEEEAQARAQLEFVKRRLADLAEFERRARGK
jgi:hypothetical protein